jgi:NSS family neurotransmitter:Na+ symporter
VGWWQVLICVVIGAYYALILAWAINYMVFSVDKRWGDDPEAYFFGEYTQSLTGADVHLSMDWVVPILVTFLLVWVALIIIMVLGVQNGIAKSNMVAIPLLVVMFVILVIQAMRLPGAFDGLNALFTPNWSALTHPGVWVAAYGQIFFSLSVAFGIMLTYSSYLKKKSDLTGSGLVVAFANSGFELLAGIGVFGALGFMAQANGVQVGEVVSNGIGLAFIAFPAIISEAPGGAVIGVLFFGSLVLAGFTSLVSIIEVIIAAIQDKFGLARIPATLVVTIPMAVITTLVFPTTMGLALLDTLDAFVNAYGIVAVAVVAVLILAYVVRGLPTLRDHLDFRGSFKIGKLWMVCVAVIAPLVLVVSLVLSTRDMLTAGEPYSGYPAWFVGVFGWGTMGALAVFAIVFTLIPWPKKSLDRVAKARADFDAEDEHPAPVDPKGGTDR